MMGTPLSIVGPVMTPLRVSLALSPFPCLVSPPCQGPHPPFPLCHGRNFMQPFLVCVTSWQRLLTGLEHQAWPNTPQPV